MTRISDETRIRRSVKTEKQRKESAGQQESVVRRTLFVESKACFKAVLMHPRKTYDIPR